MGTVEVSAFLTRQAEALRAALLARPLDVEAGRRTGAALVDAHFTGADTLWRSVALLGEAGTELVEPGEVGEVGEGGALRERLSSLQGAFAAGFSSALQERTLGEQEAIRQAVLAARDEAEQARRTSEARFRAVFADAAIGIVIIDASGRLLEVNQAFADMLGYAVEEFPGRAATDFVHPQDAPEFWDQFAQLVAGEREHFQGDKRFFRRDRQAIWTFLRASSVRDAQGRPSFHVALVEDVTERRSLHSRLRHQATHDPLTGLPNRALFVERLTELFDTAPEGARVGVLYLDLDGFKAINDTLGHDIGDKLLVAVARRLAASASAGGHLVARMGGDEFVILVADTSPEATEAHAAKVTELADQILNAIREPIRIQGHELAVSASIGIVERPIAGAHPAEVVRAADVTLYWAKAEGRSRWALFDPDRNAREVTRYTLSATMPAALDRGEFFVEYQPMVRLSDGAVTGVEALVRWQHPQFGLLAPDQFVGLAEETGVIVSLGRWVLERACAQARRWPVTADGKPPFVSVNLAIRQARDRDLLTDVRKALDSTGLPPDRLLLEVTESAIMETGDGSLETLHTLTEDGVRVGIDDFGTGYSNLAYLRRLPAHMLKIAASFVAGLRPLRGGVPDGDGVDDQIVSTLVSLSHTLGMTVTAEGVETADQAERLRALGCDAAQGFFFARAVPEDQITGLLAARGGPGLGPLDRRHHYH
jgi:diguanylate cyclase (GGDEF)-like protein/PAS domain S-box-containing protein